MAVLGRREDFFYFGKVMLFERPRSPILREKFLKIRVMLGWVVGSANNGTKILRKCLGQVTVVFTPEYGLRAQRGDMAFVSRVHAAQHAASRCLC